jgi:cold shock protein
MPEGVVKWFSLERGYGFIAPDGGGKDLFVHHSQIAEAAGAESLSEGRRVRFEVEEAERGPQAVKVTPL